MKLNESKADRTIRVVIGATILVAGVLFGSWWGLVGLIPLFTGIAGWCPLYSVLGFSTLRESLRERRAGFRPGAGAL